MVRLLKLIMKRVNDVCEIVAGLMLTVMTLAIFLQVVYRAFGSGIDWSEELARFLQIALVLLGTSICAHYGSNIAIDTLIQKVAPAWRRRLLITVDLLSLWLFFEMVRYGLMALQITIRQISPSLGIPLGVVYGAVLAGCFLTFMHIFVHLLELVFDWNAMCAREEAANAAKT
jgi:TRAP-type C4-dicarboxylate transport system permease small subunit